MTGQLHDLAALLPGKEPLVPIGYEAGWIPEPVWIRCRREKFPAPAGSGTPIVQPIPTELPWLFHSSSNYAAARNNDIELLVPATCFYRLNVLFLTCHILYVTTLLN